MKEEKSLGKMMLELIQVQQSLVDQVRALERKSDKTGSLVLDMNGSIIALQVQCGGLRTDFSDIKTDFDGVKSVVVGFKGQLMTVDSRLTGVARSLDGIKYDLTDLAIKTEENKQAIFKLVSHVELAHDTVAERVTKLEETVFPK